MPSHTHSVSLLQPPSRRRSSTGSVRKGRPICRRKAVPSKRRTAKAKTSARRSLTLNSYFTCICCTHVGVLSLVVMTISGICYNNIVDLVVGSDYYFCIYSIPHNITQVKTPYSSRPIDRVYILYVRYGELPLSNACLQFIVDFSDMLFSLLVKCYFFPCTRRGLFDICTRRHFNQLL